MDRVHRVAADTAGHRPSVASALLPLPVLRRGVRLPDRVEWPTLWIAGGIYLPMAASLALVGLGLVAWWALAPLMAWCVAWQASLQHEVIHGHPTPHAWLNRLIAGPPLMVFLPFDRYRDSHLAHHVDERLTDPLDDPESWYVTAARWRHISSGQRGLRMAMNTLAGRVVLGPLWVMAHSVSADLLDLIAGRRLRPIALHVAQVIAWGGVLAAVGVPVWGYMVAVVWPASGLILVRSFAEHRPARDPAERSVIVESVGVFDLLFLSNNLHALHHERPGLPWYLLRRVFRDGRASILDRNGAYQFDSYAKVAARYLFVPRDHPIHPSDR